MATPDPAAGPSESLARDDEPVILSPEEEAEIEHVIAETDDDFRAGRGITWEQFLAQRASRRVG